MSVSRPGYRELLLRHFHHYNPALEFALGILSGILTVELLDRSLVEIDLTATERVECLAAVLKAQESLGDYAPTFYMSTELIELISGRRPDRHRAVEVPNQVARI